MMWPLKWTERYQLPGWNMCPPLLYHMFHKHQAAIYEGVWNAEYVCLSNCFLCWCWRFDGRIVRIYTLQCKANGPDLHIHAMHKHTLRGVSMGVTRWPTVWVWQTISDVRGSNVACVPWKPSLGDLGVEGYANSMDSSPVCMGYWKKTRQHNTRQQQGNNDRAPWLLAFNNVCIAQPIRSDWYCFYFASIESFCNSNRVCS